MLYFCGCNSALAVQADHGRNEAVDGDRGRQVQRGLAHRQGHHLPLHPLGQHDGRLLAAVHLPQPRRQPEGLPQRRHQPDAVSGESDTQRTGSVAAPQVEGATKTTATTTSVQVIVAVSAIYRFNYL